MKKFILYLSLVLLLSENSVNGESMLFPSADFPLYAPLPKAFRIPAEGVWKEKVDKSEPSKQGLERLKISASGQFIETGFVLMLSKLPENHSILVIDLREESHGYINGIPISWKAPDSTWTNIGKNLQQILSDEISRLQDLLHNKQVILDPLKDPFSLAVFKIETEQDLVTRHGATYLRLPITENHKPSDETVDKIIKILLNLPKNQWIHVHCHGGKGRTTTFLALYDILINGCNISLEEILKRHNLLGGSDFKKKVDKNEQNSRPWEERLAFIRKFYEYYRSSSFNSVSWTTWNQGI